MTLLRSVGKNIESNILGKSRVSWYLYLCLYYVKSQLLNIKKPLLAGIKITNKCNLKCRHCPFWRKDNVSLSFSGLRRALIELHELGVRILIIEGGGAVLVGR